MMQVVESFLPKLKKGTVVKVRHGKNSISAVVLRKAKHPTSYFIGLEVQQFWK